MRIAEAELKRQEASLWSVMDAAGYVTYFTDHDAARSYADWANGGGRPIHSYYECSIPPIDVRAVVVRYLRAVDAVFDIERQSHGPTKRLKHGDPLATELHAARSALDALVSGSPTEDRDAKPAVDVEAIREVIADLREYIRIGQEGIERTARQLARAIGDES